MGGVGRLSGGINQSGCYMWSEISCGEIVHKLLPLNHRIAGISKPCKFFVLIPFYSCDTNSHQC